MLREQIEARRLALELKTLDALEAMTGDLVDPREPFWDTPDFWYPIGGEQVPINYESRKRGEVLPVYLTEWGLKQIRDSCRYLAAYNEFAINALDNRVAYTLGKGLKYTVQPRKTPPPGWSEAIPDREVLEGWCRAAQAVVDDFIVREVWGEREQEAGGRCDTEGEAILRLFHTGGGRTCTRFVEPEHLRSPGGGTAIYAQNNLGVECDPEDIEDIKGYWIVQDPSSYFVPELIDAREVIHLKLNVRSTAKRGLPTFLSVRKNFERAEKLLQNMSVQAAVRATYAVLIKRRQMTPQAISAHAQANADYTQTDPTSGLLRMFQKRLPGGIVETDAASEYEFPGADVDAAAFVNVLQAELRAIASRLNMPEYMLTADASNNNYASILVAESPATRNFERLQAFYFRRLGDGCWTDWRTAGVMWRVLAIAAEYGLCPEAVKTWCELSIEGPPTVVKDKYKETDRNKTLAEKGLLSDATWSANEGLDHAQEQEQRKQERIAGGQDRRPDADGRADSQTIVALQKEFYQGMVPRAAAVANAVIVFGFTPQEAERLFPNQKPEMQAQPTQPGTPPGPGAGGPGRNGNPASVLPGLGALGEEKKPCHCQGANVTDVADVTEDERRDKSGHRYCVDPHGKRVACPDEPAGAQPADKDATGEPAATGDRRARMVEEHGNDEHNQKIARLMVETREAMDKAEVAMLEATPENRTDLLIAYYKAAAEHKRIQEAHSHESRRSFFLTYRLPLDKQARLEGRYARKSPQAEAWEKAATLLREVLSRDGPGDQSVKIRSTRSRAFYQWGEINLVSTDDAAIAAHEFGHHLEQDPAVRRLVHAFWAKRFKPEENVNLSQKFPDHGYDKGEVGNSDDMGKLFGDDSLAHYAGKRYPGGDTELVSMGLEMIYRDPVHFARTDPEYFNLIMTILQAPRERA